MAPRRGRSRSSGAVAGRTIAMRLAAVSLARRAHPRMRQLLRPMHRRQRPQKRRADRLYTATMSAALHRLAFLIAVTAWLGMEQSARIHAADWPQFRGPSGDGASTATNLPMTWGGPQGITWHAEIPGQGWSSPVVVGRRILLTTAGQTALTTERREKR